MIRAGVGIAALWLAGCGGPRPESGAATPVASVVAAPVADDGQWLMASKDYASQRFSGLGEINASNVKNLRLAWTFTTGVLGGHERAPHKINTRACLRRSTSARARTAQAASASTATQTIADPAAIRSASRPAMSRVDCGPAQLAVAIARSTNQPKERQRGIVQAVQL